MLAKDTVYFQCASTACGKQWATKLEKTGEEKHLVFLFAPGMPMALMMLEGGHQPDALIADVHDRMKKKFGEDAMMMACPIQDLFKNSKAWTEFFAETDKLVEKAKGGFTPDEKSKLITNRPGSGIIQKPGIVETLQEGRIANELGQTGGEIVEINNPRKKK